MASLDHERARLYRLVDELLDTYSDELEDDARIETAAVIAIEYYEDDGGEREAVIAAFETKRRYAQLGLLETAKQTVRGGYEEVVDDG